MVRGKEMSDPKAQQILIVEDDLDLADMLNSYFRVQGYEVVTANRGTDAVRISGEINPDLVVLDIRLPDIDGYDVCRQIRANRLTSNMPVIFLTEKRDRVDKLAGLELGVVDYITKPFDIQELRLRVRNALTRAANVPQTNPVTKLPEPVITEKNLKDLLKAEHNWVVMALQIAALDRFREAYGFVASDDVLRAVTLMIQNGVKDAGAQDGYLGHFNGQDFVIITDKEKSEVIQKRIENRLQQSLAYFYPLQDRANLQNIPANKRLHLLLGMVYKEKYDDIETLKKAILAAPDTIIQQTTLDMDF